MDKIKKSLKALGMILRKPYLLNLILDNNDNWFEYVQNKYPDLVKLPEITLTELFGHVDETVSPFTFLDGGSLPTDLALLRGLARKTTNCRYLEIGTWRGESAANVSPVAAECYTIDLPDEDKRALGMTEDYIQEHAKLSAQLSNVNHLKVNSLTFDFSSLGKKFDLIFIDGDHHNKGVLNDTQKVFANLVHEDSIVVWHDYAYNPERVRYEVFAAILDGLPFEYHKHLFHVSNTMCAIYLPYPIQSNGLPEPIFEVHLKTR